MDGVWLPVLTLAPLAVTMGGMVWLASVVRRRGVGGSVMAPIQEMWDPAPYRSNIAIEILAERKAPTPSPGDPPWLPEFE